MQVLGLITVSIAGLLLVSTASVSLFAALPQVMLAYAERHGRFQGLNRAAQTVSGTRARLPPFGARLVLQLG
jgi:hypothetical protein